MLAMAEEFRDVPAEARDRVGCRAMVFADGLPLFLRIELRSGYAAVPERIGTALRTKGLPSLPTQ
jgi:hypothetical protein